MADFGSAVFRTAPFPVRAREHEFTFPCRSAQEWLGVLGSDNWIVAAVGSLGNDDHDRLLDLIENGELGEADVRALAHAALAGAGGRPWWEAQRLAAACMSDGGRLLGAVLTGGVDPSRLTLAAFLACVWATLTKGADAQQIVKLEAELVIPPPEATPEEREELDDDMGSMVERLRSMPGVSIG